MSQFFKLSIAHVAQWYCYNNIRASLVLILVSVLGFSDANAFTAYATMIALGDINGLAGAYYGDQVVGHHFAWIFGAMLLLIGYFIAAFFFTYLQSNIVFLLNMIACGIGIARCNVASLIYTYINKEYPENQRNSYNSLLYLLLVLGSFLAYISSGYITRKFGAQGCFATSGIFTLFSITVFTIVERKALKAYVFSFKKIISLSLCAIALFIFGIFSFHFYQIINFALWLSLLGGLSVMLYLAYNRKSKYKVEEKQHIIIFIYYIFWFILYYTFERQFGMIMPLFLSRNFDTNFLSSIGITDIPVTVIMSIFQFTIMICSIIFFKMKIHDKLSNGRCLIIGFGSSLSGFILLFIGCKFHYNYNILPIMAILPIILFSMSDLFMLNRIFSICRVAPKAIHAVTIALMMIAAACGFHGARLIASIVEIDKSQILEKSTTLAIYQKGFLVNITILTAIIILLLISYCFKDTAKLMKKIL